LAYPANFSNGKQYRALGSVRKFESQEVGRTYSSRIACHRHILTICVHVFFTSSEMRRKDFCVPQFWNRECVASLCSISAWSRTTVLLSASSPTPHGIQNGHHHYILVAGAPNCRVQMSDLFRTQWDDSLSQPFKPNRRFAEIILVSFKRFQMSRIESCFVFAYFLRGAKFIAHGSDLRISSSFGLMGLSKGFSFHGGSEYAEYCWHIPTD
jgi:hypothetical protein